MPLPRPFFCAGSDVKLKHATGGSLIPIVVIEMGMAFPSNQSQETTGGFAWRLRIKIKRAYARGFIGACSRDDQAAGVGHCFGDEGITNIRPACGLRSFAAFAKPNRTNNPAWNSLSHPPSPILPILPHLSLQVKKNLNRR